MGASEGLQRNVRALQRYPRTGTFLLRAPRLRPFQNAEGLSQTPLRTTRYRSICSSVFGFLEDEKKVISASFRRIEPGFLADEYEAAVRRVVANELFGNSMPVKIPFSWLPRRSRRINDREQSAGFQRAKQGSEHRIVFPHLMVSVHN